MRQWAAQFTAIEESREMAERYQGPPDLVVADAVGFDYEPFDFAVCFLVLMFLPIETRTSFLSRLQGLIKPGGALLIVDKIQTPPGYVGTAYSRLTLQQKLAVGAKPEAILAKELSLAGYQRPLDPATLPQSARTFFQVREFVGWILEADVSCDSFTQSDDSTFSLSIRPASSDILSSSGISSEVALRT